MYANEGICVNMHVKVKQINDWYAVAMAWIANKFKYATSRK